MHTLNDCSHARLLQCGSIVRDPTVLNMMQLPPNINVRVSQDVDRVFQQDSHDSLLQIIQTPTCTVEHFDTYIIGYSAIDSSEVFPSQYLIVNVYFRKTMKF